MAGNLFSKMIGLTALGLATYDTFATTRLQTPRLSKFKHLERLEDIYLRTDSSATESVLINNLQNGTRSWHLTDNWLFRMKDNVVSYVSNFCSNVVNNATTLGLGAVAFLSGKKGTLNPTQVKNLKFFPKLMYKIKNFAPIKVPVLGKIAAGLLAIKAGSFILHDLFGVGASSSRYYND